MSSHGVEFWVVFSCRMFSAFIESVRIGTESSVLGSHVATAIFLNHCAPLVGWSKAHRYADVDEVAHTVWLLGDSESVEQSLGAPIGSVETCKQMWC